MYALVSNGSYAKYSSDIHNDIKAFFFLMLIKTHTGANRHHPFSKVQSGGFTKR